MIHDTFFYLKYAPVKPLTNKKAKAFLDDFIGIEHECKDKSNKLWVDQERLCKPYAKMVRR